MLFMVMNSRGLVGRRRRRRRVKKCKTLEENWQMRRRRERKTKRMVDKETGWSGRTKRKKYNHYMVTLLLWIMGDKIYDNTSNGQWSRGTDKKGRDGQTDSKWREWTAHTYETGARGERLKGEMMIEMMDFHSYSTLVQLWFSVIWSYSTLLSGLYLFSYICVEQPVTLKKVCS